MIINYKENTLYGQEVMEAIAILTELQDPQIDYTKTEIIDRLKAAKGMIEIIIMATKKPGFDYCLKEEFE